MTDRERLKLLMERSEENKGEFGRTTDGRQAGRGMIPEHYKRMSLSEEEQKRMSKIGLSKILSAFGVKLYYTQAIIAGVILSGDYDKVGIITPSQYGKSYTMGMISLLMAYEGHRVNVAGATSDKTDIIMQSCRSAASNAHPDIKKALSQEAVKKVDRLDQSLSKARLSFSGRGSVQGITLGDMFEDVSRNKAVGQGGAYIVDEAAFVSSKAMAEIGRREFSSVDGKKEPLVMISNPHGAGYFYDFITKDELKPRECVIWMDALTSVQEQRWTKEDVLGSDFAEHSDTLQRYLLCELPTQGAGMFGDVKVEEKGDGISVMGIDAAYRGKDQIEVCIAKTGEKVYFESIAGVKPKKWIEGVTPKDIIKRITKAYFATGCAICCVDIGFGVWLLEGLLENGVNAKGVNFGAGATKERIKAHHYSAVNAANKRAEMHLDLADLIENQGCAFSPEVYGEIKDILPMVVSERKSNGKIQVIPKAEIKAKLGHSPDALDAVLLALHAAVLYSDETFYMV